MSANVESMFYAGREKPWHGLGTQVEEAPTSADALRLAGLDWTVQRKPIQVCGGRKVDNFFANVRSSDGAVLGVVVTGSVFAGRVVLGAVLSCAGATAQPVSSRSDKQSSIGVYLHALWDAIFTPQPFILSSRTKYPFRIPPERT